MTNKIKFFIYIIYKNNMPKFVMSDGRMFTDYQPSCDLNNYIQNKYQIKNSHEYRIFLQKNAEQIMKDMTQCNEGTESKICPICKEAIDYKPQNQ